MGAVNLLTDGWIETDKGLLSISDILCNDEFKNVLLKYNDSWINFAVLQLVIQIVQTIFITKNKIEFEERLSGPLKEEVYFNQIQPYINCFEHDEFLQKKDIDNKTEATPIHKLFSQPVGDCHTHHIKISQLKERVCPQCVLISMFNLLINEPWTGQGYFPPLSSAKHIKVIIHDDSLRNTIWKNVLTKETIENNNLYRLNDSWKFNWENPKISFKNIDFRECLFWCPSSVKIIWKNENNQCDNCGRESSIYSSEMVRIKKEKENKGEMFDFVSPFSYYCVENGKISSNVVWSESNRIIGIGGNFLLSVVNGGETKKFLPPFNVQQIKEYRRRNKIHFLIRRQINNKDKIIEKDFYCDKLEISWSDVESTAAIIRDLQILIDLVSQYKSIKNKYYKSRNLNPETISSLDGCVKSYKNFHKEENNKILKTKIIQCIKEDAIKTKRKVTGSMTIEKLKKDERFQKDLNMLCKEER
jgi:hypothetical protein